MKIIKQNILSLLFVFTFLLLPVIKIMAQEDTAAGTPVVKLHYYNNNNSIQYVILESSLKKNKVFTPQKNKSYALFLDQSTPENLIGNILTDNEGKAKVFVPPSLKAAWDAAGTHNFIVKEGEEEIISDYAITKSMLTIDTASEDGVRTITVTAMKWEKNKWIPASDVEMKIGIERQASILSAGTTETYTTDSAGKATVELKRDSLPGDVNGNYTLAARVEDNDLFGNILVEKNVPWGVPTTIDTNFFNIRALWTTRFKTPYWLLFMAYSIVIGIWGTLIYLIVQMVKIAKMGKTP